MKIEMNFYKYKPAFPDEYISCCQKAKSMFSRKKSKTV